MVKEVVAPRAAFEHCPGQTIMALEIAKKAPEIDHCVNNLSAVALDHEMIDASYPLAMRAMNGGALYFSARDQALAPGGRSSG